MNRKKFANRENDDDEKQSHFHTLSLSAASDSRLCSFSFTYRRPLFRQHGPSNDRERDFLKSDDSKIVEIVVYTSLQCELIDELVANVVVKSSVAFCSSVDTR